MDLTLTPNELSMLPSPAELQALQQQLQDYGASDDPEQHLLASTSLPRLPTARSALGLPLGSPPVPSSFGGLQSPQATERQASQQGVGHNRPASLSELLAATRHNDCDRFEQARQAHFQYRSATGADNLQLPSSPPNDTYPAAECSQEEALADGTAFYVSLQSLHEHLGTAEKVPRVGGRELDLHMLYRNVCALGGCEKVISSKLWREASESFNFPDTITSVSTALRKAYISLLWDYEQVYAHGMSGEKLVPAPPPLKDGAGPLPAEPPTPNASLAGRPSKRRRFGDSVATTFVGLQAGAPNQLVASARGLGSPDAFSVGSRGSVTVDSRFDAGYFVTVKVAKQQFQGILYYPPPEQVQETAAAEKLKELALPKPNKLPFNFFSVDARLKAKEAYPGASQVEITKKVAEMWRRVSEEERSPYVAMSNQDKQRYQSELEAYNCRLAAQAAAQAAGQASQAVAAAQLASSHRALPASCLQAGSADAGQAEGCVPQ